MTKTPSEHEYSLRVNLSKALISTGNLFHVIKLYSQIIFLQEMIATLESSSEKKNLLRGM
jgi:hypothetical protein